MGKSFFLLHQAVTCHELVNPCLCCCSLGWAILLCENVTPVHKAVEEKEKLTLLPVECKKKEKKLDWPAMMSSTSNTSGVNAGLEPDLIVHQCRAPLLPLLMLWRLKRTDLRQGASPDVKAKPRRDKGIIAVIRKKKSPITVLLFSTSFHCTLVCAWIFSLHFSLFCPCPSQFFAQNSWYE